MASPAVRFIASPKKPMLGSIHIQLHVKPGAHKDREGVSSVTDTAIDLCVSAQAKEGEANKAVIGVLSEALGVSKSKLQLSRGMRSRDKLVVLDADGSGGQAYAEAVLDTLRKASHS